MLEKYFEFVKRLYVSNNQELKWENKENLRNKSIFKRNVPLNDISLVFVRSKICLSFFLFQE